MSSTLPEVKKSESYKLRATLHNPLKGFPSHTRSVEPNCTRSMQSVQLDTSLRRVQFGRGVRIPAAAGALRAPLAVAPLAAALRLVQRDLHLRGRPGALRSEAAQSARETARVHVRRSRGAPQHPAACLSSGLLRRLAVIPSPVTHHTLRWRARKVPEVVSPAVPKIAFLTISARKCVRCITLQ